MVDAAYCAQFALSHHGMYQEPHCNMLITNENLFAAPFLARWSSEASRVPWCILTILSVAMSMQSFKVYAQTTSSCHIKPQASAPLLFPTLSSERNNFLQWSSFLETGMTLTQIEGDQICSIDPWCWTCNVYDGTRASPYRSRDGIWYVGYNARRE